MNAERRLQKEICENVNISNDQWKKHSQQSWKQVFLVTESEW